MSGHGLPDEVVHHSSASGIVTQTHLWSVWLKHFEEPLKLNHLNTSLGHYVQDMALCDSLKHFSCDAVVYLVNLEHYL